MNWAFSALVGSLSLLILFYKLILYPLYVSPLARVPGPISFAVTKWRIALDEWRGKRTQIINQLHQQYGPVVRIGPSEVHFNSSTALRTIYGAGSGFERTDFYRIFDVYGKQTAFTFGPSHLHAERKKLVAHFYSRSSIIRGAIAQEIEAEVQNYLKVIESTLDHGHEIFQSLHWYSLDNTTNFIYGRNLGGTSAMSNVEHQTILDDILDPSRRQLAWCVVHFPSLTTWLYSQTGLAEKIISPFLPMQKPVAYTRIRTHALKAMQDFRASINARNDVESSQHSMIGRLWEHHESRKEGGLSDLDIAAECSDHLLAGILTTSDTLVFLIWALSLPQNRRYQEKLIKESQSIPDVRLNDGGNPTVETTLKLPYFDAVVKETLRLYAPLPASEPRQSPLDNNIDGYFIPAGTVVSMQPYSLHRNPDIFPDPLRWDPDRWLVEPEKLANMKKWWWAFSSGGRMCVGIHLALAEMALVPAIYRKYKTRIETGFEGITPGIISRFEVFSDETFDRIEEHKCWIKFDKI